MCSFMYAMLKMSIFTFHRRDQVATRFNSSVSYCNWLDAIWSGRNVAIFTSFPIFDHQLLKIVGDLKWQRPSNQVFHIIKDNQKIAEKLRHAKLNMSMWLHQLVAKQCLTRARVAVSAAFAVVGGGGQNDHTF